MQVKEKTPFDAHVAMPVGATPERRTGWMWALIIVLGAAVLALGATVVYPALTTTSGERVMNDMMDAWNSGEVTAFPDVYDHVAFFVLSSGESYNGLTEIEQAAEEAQANGFLVERTGPATESDGMIAYPATVTTDTATEGAMIVLRYGGDGLIVEQTVVWQTP